MSKNKNNSQELFKENKAATEQPVIPQTETPKDDGNKDSGKKEYVITGDMTIRHSGTTYHKGDHIFLSDEECSEQLKIYLSEV